MKKFLRKIEAFIYKYLPERDKLLHILGNIIGVSILTGIGLLCSFGNILSIILANIIMITLDITKEYYLDDCPDSEDLISDALGLMIIDLIILLL